MTGSARVVKDSHEVITALGDIPPQDLANACVMLLLFSYDKGVDPVQMPFEQFAEEVQFSLLQNRKMQTSQGGDGVFVGVAGTPGWRH